MKIAVLTQDLEFYGAQRLIESAKELGHECDFIKVSDLSIIFNDSETLTSDIIYNEKSLTNYDLVIIHFVFSYTRLVIGIIEYLRNEGVKVFDNNLTIVSNNVNKVKDGILLSINNNPYPQTVSTMNEKNFRTYCMKLGFPVIVKSIHTGAGIGVHKLDSEKDIDKFLYEEIEVKEKKIKNYIIQEFIPYEKDLRIFVVDKKIIGAMQRIPAPGEFRANFSQGGSVKRIDIDESIENIVIKSVESTNAIHAGVDILVTKDNKKYVLEVNRSPGFEGFEQATNINVAKLIIESSIKNSK